MANVKTTFRWCAFTAERSPFFSPPTRTLSLSSQIFEESRKGRLLSASAPRSVGNVGYANKSRDQLCFIKFISLLLSIFTIAFPFGDKKQQISVRVGGERVGEATTFHEVEMLPESITISTATEAFWRSARAHDEHEASTLKHTCEHEENSLTSLFTLDDCTTVSCGLLLLRCFLFLTDVLGLFIHHALGAARHRSRTSKRQS